MSDEAMIRLLARKGILGTTPAEVRRALIRRAIVNLVETEFVQKWVEERALLDSIPTK